jgi:uncharacterized protein YbdZ (MbtH family)
MDDQESYRVVRNDEEQYSIWPVRHEPPAGWHAEDFEGPKDACLAYIDEVWTDMRPLSLRKALAAAAGRPAESTPAEIPSAPDLVTRLCEGDHRVEVVLRPEPSIERLRGALDKRYVHLRFVDTNGGTEVGVALAERTDLSDADLDSGTGSLLLVGELTLDFEKLRCEAVVGVSGLTGHGHLQRV